MSQSQYGRNFMPVENKLDKRAALTIRFGQKLLSLPRSGLKDQLKIDLAKSNLITEIQTQRANLLRLKVVGNELNSHFSTSKYIFREQRLSFQANEAPEEQTTFPSPEVRKIKNILENPNYSCELLKAVENVGGGLEELPTSRTQTVFSPIKSSQVGLKVVPQSEIDHICNVVLSNPQLKRKMGHIYAKMTIEKSEQMRISEIKRLRNLVKVSQQAKNDNPQDRGSETSRNPFIHQRGKFHSVRSTAFQSSASLGKSIEADSGPLSAIWSLHQNFRLVVLGSNGLSPCEERPDYYKVHIQTLNNPTLLKSIVKRRPWLKLRSEADLKNCEFIWTDWKKERIFQMLNPCVGEFSNSQPGRLRFDNKHRRHIGYERILGQCNVALSEPQKQTVTQEIKKPFKVYNHLPGILYLHSKRLMFETIVQHAERSNKRWLLSYVPETHLLYSGEPEELTTVQEAFNKHASKPGSKNLWICKPGENSNQGNGISVQNTFEGIVSCASTRHSAKAGASTIIQKYIERPMLYKGRKFDLRCFILVTTYNGQFKVYWYENGYVRTASEEYTPSVLGSKLTHLTNDAVQKRGDDYGKYQSFNKLTLNELKDYLNAEHSSCNLDQTFSKLKQLATELGMAVADKCNPGHKDLCFELIGLDFMLDEQGHPFLIEANSNPSLCTNGKVLSSFMTPLIQNMFSVAIDPVLMPHESWKNMAKSNTAINGNPFANNEFSLIVNVPY